jgi:hypothetical protein
MKKLAAVALALATAAIPSVAAARGKVYGSEKGRPLTAPSKAAPADIAAEFMRARGKSGLTMASVRASEAPGRNGLTHVRLEQVVDGLRVHGAYARAAVNDRGELVHAIDALVPVGPVRRATVNERQALAAVLAKLHPGAGAADYFHAPPTVERVIVQRDGGLAQGFLVVTWSNRRTSCTTRSSAPTAPSTTSSCAPTATRTASSATARSTPRRAWRRTPPIRSPRRAAGSPAPSRPG